MVAVIAVAFALAAGAQPPRAVQDMLVNGKIELPEQAGSPIDHLPANGKVLTSFGERPQFSPDGTRIAFIGKSYGDAFEYDLHTGKTRNLTSHTPNGGFLRIHYMADGSYLLLGPRKMGISSMATRFTAIELWHMDKDATGPIKPLGQFPFEGIAVSAKTNKIAWVVREPRLTPKTGPVDGYTAMMSGNVVIENGTPKLVNIKESARTKWSKCYLEPQDFYDNDSKVTASCYVFEKPLSEVDAANYRMLESKVWTVDLANGALNIIPTPPGLYAEVEGIFPDGKQTLVECGNGEKSGLDVCMLDMTGTKPRYTRLTYATTYGGYRFSNPVVSPDGKKIAFQAGRAATEPGVGDGILMIDAPAR
ncbi:hypothetical protein PQ455_02640 [Sphingomonas naphthae]|uniref:Translocation protein TolB n=1 Tax=Sphingomonas naphthae TaxID=1813468 RepID=A0ABY7TLN3_9SPHN|nr:hypothetical protein [Sphingomonas naphthae]WCT74148.1 hypothetical protein PQ455_02640 [Sphingomonas naphthae]